MTANQHPFPAHVVEAVARGMYADDCQDDSQLDPNAEPHPGYYEYAQAALQALWDASRVDTLDELEALPDHSFIVDESGCCIAKTPDAGADYLPAYILHWGNHD